MYRQRAETPTTRRHWGVTLLIIETPALVRLRYSSGTRDTPFRSRDTLHHLSINRLTMQLATEMSIVTAIITLVITVFFMSAERSSLRVAIHASSSSTGKICCWCLWLSVCVVAPRHFSNQDGYYMASMVLFPRDLSRGVADTRADRQGYNPAWACTWLYHTRPVCSEEG